MGALVDLFTADRAAKAQKDVSRDQIAASDRATAQTLALQKEQFDKVWNGTAVQREAGDAATRLMSQIMGLSPASATPAAGAGQAGAAASTATPAVAENAFGARAMAREYPDNGMITQEFGALPVQNAFGGMDAAPVTTGGATTPQPVGQATATQETAPFDVTAWLRSTPAYEANFAEGARAANAKLASQGRLFSGDAARDLTEFGQNYADRIFGDQYNRLAGIAGAGQTATSQGSAAGTNYANQSSAAVQNNAARMGSSYQNRGDAISGLWGDANAAIQNSGALKNVSNAFGKAVGNWF